MEDHTKEIIGQIKKKNNTSSTESTSIEINYQKLAFISLTGLLGSGRIVSNIALVNQGMQQTFFDIGLQKAPIPQILSGMAAFSNATSDSATRLTSIYENLNKIYNKLIGTESNHKAKEDEPKHDKATCLPLQNVVYYALISAGILDMVFFALNNFSALIQLECQYINNTYCRNGFDWPHITNFMPGAVICSLSTATTFASFTLLDSLRVNANNTVSSFNNLSDAIKKTNNWIIAGTIFLGLLNAMSLGATLFFSTSKMIFNLFGAAISEYVIMQALVYISLLKYYKHLKTNIQTH